MTQKQQFISKFLRNVYKFDEVGFESDGSGCMRAVGYFQVYHPLSGNTRIRVPVDIWMDKTKKGLYSIKFKTWGSHIPMNKANEYVDRAQLYWPGAAKVEVYRRTAGCSYKGGAPTLRIVSGAIAGAFHWMTTDEGDMYWRRMSGEWEVYVQENYGYFQELQ